MLDGEEAGGGVALRDFEETLRYIMVPRRQSTVDSERREETDRARAESGIRCEK